MNYSNVVVEDQIIVNYICNKFINELNVYATAKDKSINDAMKNYINDNIQTWVINAFQIYKSEKNVNIIKLIYDYIICQINNYLTASKL